MRNSIGFLLLLLVTFQLGCSVVGNVFEAGVWIGIVAVIAVVGLILYFVNRSRKG